MKTTKTTKASRCPHCGNKDKSTIQDNGCAPSSFDYTLLCVARVDPKKWAFAPDRPENDRLDADGKVACGMQWSPNV